MRKFFYLSLVVLLGLICVGCKSKYRQTEFIEIEYTILNQNENAQKLLDGTFTKSDLCLDNVDYIIYDKNSIEKNESFTSLNIYVFLKNKSDYKYSKMIKDALSKEYIVNIPKLNSNDIKGDKYE